MKKIILTIIITITVSAQLYSLSDWDRAVQIYGAYSELKPYKMKIYSETYNGKGKLEKTEDLVYSLNYDENGETEQMLISAHENGEDITEKRRKEMEKDSGTNRRNGNPGENMEGMDKHPLDPEVQNEVKTVQTAKREYRGGRLCSVWEFSLNLNDKYSGIGKAWIDTDSGKAVSMEYHIEPLFPFVEEMNIVMEFGADSEKRWLLEKLKMSGRVNMIVIKRSFDSVASFSDYR